MNILAAIASVGVLASLGAIPASAQHVSDHAVHGPVKLIPHHHRKRCQVKYVEHHRVRKCRYY